MNLKFECLRKSYLVYNLTELYTNSSYKIISHVIFQIYPFKKLPTIIFY